MILARVVGTVVATRKDERLLGQKLLVARTVDPHGKDEAGQALDLSLRKMGEEHPRTAETRVRLGAILVAEGQYPEAETLLLKGRAAREKALGPDHRNTRKAVEELVKLYDAWGKPDKAAPLRALLPAPPGGASPKKG